MSLGNINVLNNYERKSTNLSIEFINNKYIENYYIEYRNIEEFVKEMNHSELTETFASLREFTNTLLSTIEDFEVLFNRVFSDEDWNQITNLLSRVYDFDEEKADSVDKIFEFITEVKNGKCLNPLKEKIYKITSSKQVKGNVTLIDYNTAQIIEINDDTKKLEIISPNSYLKSNCIYNYIIFLGSPRKFEDYNSVFLSENILYLVYSFFKGEFKKQFLDINGNRGINTIYKDIEFDTPENKVGTYKQQPDDPLKRILKNFKREIEESNSSEESIKARMIYLNGNKYIFVPLGSKVNIINFDLNKNVDLKLEKININQLRPGNWLLNTLFVEDEFYKQKSKEYFGEENYNNALNLIEGYKVRLKKQKEIFGGYSPLKRDLERYGIEVNSLSLLRSWIEMITIKPGVLDRILEYLGYESDEVIKVLEAGDNINRAHQFVGRMMNENLNSELSKMIWDDIEDSLNEKYYFEFDIENIGKFIITEVNYIFEEEILIKNKDLYKIRDID